jgi:hypothetical protein
MRMRTDPRARTGHAHAQACALAVVVLHAACGGGGGAASSDAADGARDGSGDTRDTLVAGDARETTPADAVEDASGDSPAPEGHEDAPTLDAQETADHEETGSRDQAADGADAPMDVTPDAPTDGHADALADGHADALADARADAPDATTPEPPCPLLSRGTDEHPTTVCPTETALVPLAARNDWRVQDYPENLGVVAVGDMRAQGVPGLVLSLRLNDPADAIRQRKGEVLLDLRYVPGVEGRAPVDMRDRALGAVVQVPSALADGRNGLQLFVKDDRHRAQYGRWQNLDRCGSQTITLRPGPHAPDQHAYTEPGFDPAAVRILGLKVGLGEASSTSYVGLLQLRQLTIAPPIALQPEPDLPPASSRPSLVGRRLESQGGRILVDATPAFIVGGNWRVIEYGQNFGATSWFPLGNGVSRHAGFVRCELDRFRRAGVQWLRVGLLDDGRAVLDAAGNVLPDLRRFHEDVAKLLELAQAAGIAVELAFADFLLGGPARTIDGVVVQGRRAVLDNPATRAMVFSQLLDPFLARYGAHPAFLGFDCLNEPEWIVSKADGGGWEDVKDQLAKATAPIAAAELRAFVSACAASVRAHLPGGLVTLGVSAKMAALHQHPALDYAAAHHYGWMGALGDLVPGLPPGRAWILEEYPSAAGAPDVGAYLESAAALGASGALIWNLAAGLDEHTMRHDQREEVLRALSAWRR